MILMNGLGAYDDPNNPEACKHRPDWDVCMRELASQNATNNQPQLWQTILGTVVTGAVTGLVHGGGGPATPPGPGQVGYIPPYVPPEPWYSTPVGMIGIGVGVLGLIFLLKK